LHWALRYGLAILIYGLTIGLSLLLSHFEAQINLTIPVVLAMVATAWYGGRGPGLLLSVLFEGTTIIFAKLPPNSSLPKAIFSYFSVFTLYVFLTFLISGLRSLLHRLREQRDLLQVTLSSIGDAVVATDTEGVITFMNPTAERLTGWKEISARGIALDKVVRIVNEETGRPVINPAARVLETKTPVGLANHSVLIGSDGRQVPIDDTASPIRDGDDVIGAVLVFSDISERKLAEQSRRETAIMHSLVEAQEAERRRIARDLHDQLGQRMTALRLRIEAVMKKCSEHPDLGLEIEEVQRSASEVDHDIAFLAWELRPTELENLGLADALASFVREWSRQYGIAAEFHSGDGSNGTPAPRLSQEVETNLYRIVQEALHNVLKHSDAKSVNVLLHQRKDNVTVIVEDDGRGFKHDSGPLDASKLGGLGLIGMHERAALMKGTLDIESDPGKGTTVVVKIPVPEAVHDSRAIPAASSA
jgi:PAS domain S-box-containing protein